MPLVRIRNRGVQTHAILLKDEKGVLATRFVPAQGFVEVEADRLPKDAYDKARHGHVSFQLLKEKKAQTAPLPKPKQPLKTEVKPEVKPAPAPAKTAEATKQGPSPAQAGVAPK